ncbi:uncharacterized protein K452DRAFT_285717 [Aplosporella prunicola CBS 121167]|uniref:Uncharacterized protein n=1 Tax=Aplosporella prunicola CBS 121167 TaxID=1176127 RepID=A0A6A6BHR3_9PEZI|nr:uncharacterized protein K452DRAFT_285717 [Aplosporella prunicola CBS 121167]KAF2143682.1 hypothetical protein K452DRAFT_285717 [Aplosporella prunicola CBS 121167]
MSDSEKCFTYLCDNIPSWIESLAHVRKRIEDKQDEVEKVPVVQKIRKSGSTESLKPGKENFLEQETGDYASPNALPNASNETSEIPNQATRLAQANRKRKTASVISKQSAVTKYRTRTMIVVYYDSEVQKAFENLVRNIGTGRNLLRKGKMAARMEAMTAETGPDDNEDDDDFDPVLSKIGYRPRVGIGAFRTTRGMGGPGGLDGGSEAFDTADKALENAQSLCERGAHQVLRDGDCRTEVDGARKAFEEVSKLAEQEAAKQKEKAEKAAEKARQREERRKSQPADRNSSSTMDTDSKLLPATDDSKLFPATVSSAPKIDHIEVDVDGSDDDFVMPTLPRLRLTSRV